MITTAASDPASRSCFRVSRPSIPGSQTSSRMQPYARRPSALRHSSPVATASATKPSSSITARSVSRMPRSSSTMRIESITVFNPQITRMYLPLCNLWMALVCRQFNHKLRAAWMVALGADVAAVLHYDSLHDREAETSATVTSRKIRLEQTAEIARLDSVSCVCNLRAQHTPLRIVARRDCDLHFTIRRSERVDRVVDQVNKPPLDLFHVEHRRWQLAIEIERQHHAIETIYIQTRCLSHDVIQVCEIESCGRQTSKT